MFGKTPSPEQTESALRLREIEQLLMEKEAELREKDQTVQELTQRLSQTVERLDRFQRVGSDRSVRMAAFPKEIVEQQSELVEDLKRAVQMWEDMQIACGLGRVEMQMSDLRALFEEHFKEEEPEPEPEEPAAETDPDSEEAGSEEASLEEDSDGATDQERASDLEDFDDPEDDICPLRPPEILNLDEANVDALRRCVLHQDEYIDYLSARLRRTAEKQTSVDWNSLAEHPDRLTRQLEHTSTMLQQSRHFAEFELALQRTRLKRRERELAMLSTELEAQMQAVPRGETVAQEESSPQNRRWLRMLGVNKDDQ